ncbi:hypothetical protein BLNAU_20418 [Blattamonas nauphoetae]|uniref:Uncharacterized protein n=1 Tax=Blattamonas nauphoetae TaxID=2049346 RepID=A0ABQ9WYU9_9EUKA|nr:hypothetical protein BLNAU_20418 [Blattamonas nauphoetae]
MNSNSTLQSNFLPERADKQPTLHLQPPSPQIHSSTKYIQDFDVLPSNFVKSGDSSRFSSHSSPTLHFRPTTTQPSEKHAFQCHPLQHLNNRAPHRIHAPLRMYPTYRKYAQPHTPLTLLSLSPTLALSSDTTDHPNTHNSMCSNKIESLSSLQHPRGLRALLELLSPTDFLPTRLHLEG